MTNVKEPSNVGFPRFDLHFALDILFGPFFLNFLLGTVLAPREKYANYFCAFSLSGSHAVEKGSLRLGHVICGVSPQITSANLSHQTVK